MCENYCRMQLLYQLRKKKIMENNQYNNIYDRINKNVQNQRIYDQELSNSESTDKESIFPFIIRKQLLEQIQTINNDKNRRVVQNKAKINARITNNTRSISVCRKIEPNDQKKMIYDHLNTKLDKEKKTIIIFSQRYNPLKNDYIYRYCKQDSYLSQSNNYNNQF
ncbi:unnamed protein product [Paramecium pentaurelia]|uniref:Uncharacterized protein n=1 Tax=Paramecium pentaurelia TaxID=43138 RepID=A0A8S1U2R5_9CILI|nr:unnamed protein product [Paramecium pentaurelia]